MVAPAAGARVPDIEADPTVRPRERQPDRVGGAGVAVYDRVVYQLAEQQLERGRVRNSGVLGQVCREQFARPVGSVMAPGEPDSEPIGAVQRDDRACGASRRSVRAKRPACSLRRGCRDICH